MVSSIFYFYPYLGRWSNLTIIFLRWVGQPPDNLFWVSKDIWKQSPDIYQGCLAEPRVYIDVTLRCGADGDGSQNSAPSRFLIFWSKKNWVVGRVDFFGKMHQPPGWVGWLVKHSYKIGAAFEDEFLTSFSPSFHHGHQRMAGHMCCWCFPLKWVTWSNLTCAYFFRWVQMGWPKETPTLAWNISISLSLYIYRHGILVKQHKITY